MRTLPSSKAQNLFSVELWSDDGEQILETLATAGNFLLARAAYDEAVRRYPRKRLMVRHAARVVIDSGTPGYGEMERKD